MGPAACAELNRMALLPGSLAWLAGTVMFTVTFQQLRKANRDERIPLLLGHPTRHPGKIFLYRAVALVLLMLSFYAWSDVLGYWAIGLIFIGAIPAVALNIRHNRQVQTLAGGS